MVPNRKNRPLDMAATLAALEATKPAKERAEALDKLNQALQRKYRPVNERLVSTLVDIATRDTSGAFRKRAGNTLGTIARKDVRIAGKILVDAGKIATALNQQGEFHFGAPARVHATSLMLKIAESRDESSVAAHAAILAKNASRLSFAKGERPSMNAADFALSVITKKFPELETLVTPDRPFQYATRTLEKPVAGS